MGLQFCLVSGGETSDARRNSHFYSFYRTQRSFFQSPWIHRDFSFHLFIELFVFISLSNFVIGFFNLSVFQTKRIFWIFIVELYAETQQKVSRSGGVGGRCLPRGPYIWSLFPLDSWLEIGTKNQDLQKDSPDLLQCGCTVSIVRKDDWSLKRCFEVEEFVNV